MSDIYMAKWHDHDNPDAEGHPKRQILNDPEQ